MIKLKEILDQRLRWIVGYIDSYGAIHYQLVNKGDFPDTHLGIWGSAAKMNKWRWIPTEPNHLHTYNQPLDPEDEDKIWQIIDRYRL